MFLFAPKEVVYLIDRMRALIQNDANAMKVVKGVMACLADLDMTRQDVAEARLDQMTKQAAAVKRDIHDIFAPLSGAREKREEPEQPEVVKPDQPADMGLDEARAIYTPGERQAVAVDADDAPVGFPEVMPLATALPDGEGDMRPDPGEGDEKKTAPLATDPVRQRTWTAERDAVLIAHWNAGISMGRLADKMATSTGAISQRVLILQRKGLIDKRAKSPAPSQPSAPAETDGPRHPERLTEDEMQARIDALLPLDDGWRLGDDILIMEGIVVGDGAALIAERLACTKGLVMGRMREIVPKASPHNYELALRCLRRRAVREMP